MAEMILLFLEFFKTGLFAVGGGLATLPFLYEMAEKYDLKFVYRDFRVGFREGQAKARELGLYMQKYCGCIFSEEDRYSKQINKDKELFKKIE